MRIADNITELIGSTSLVKLNHLTEGLKAQIAVKPELFDLGSNVEDRIAESMVEMIEKAGKVDKDTVIIEAISGNTSIGSAMVCAARGYRLAVTMPESTSKECKMLLRTFGTELILAPAAEGMASAIAKAQSLADEYPGTYFMPRQFDSEANPEIHRKTTAEEIRRDIDGKADIFVVGVGTGGTITDVGEVLKEYKPEAQIVVVEPEAPPVSSGGEKGPHSTQGLGAGFILNVLNMIVYDSISKVPSEAAFEAARAMAEKKGILVGISPGAAVWNALQLVRKPENEGKLIVVLLPSYGERYLSTPLFADLA